MTREDGSSVTLSLANQICCAVGRDRLHTAQIKHTYRWLGDGSVPVFFCTQKTECARQLRNIEIAFKGTLPGVYALDPWQSIWETMLCVSCMQHAKADMTYGRYEVWRALPDMFDLAGWDSLADEETTWVIICD